MGGWMEGWMGVWMDGWAGGSESDVSGCLVGWFIRWTYCISNVAFLMTCPDVVLTYLLTTQML